MSKFLKLSGLTLSLALLITGYQNCSPFDSQNYSSTPTTFADQSSTTPDEQTLTPEVVTEQIPVEEEEEETTTAEPPAEVLPEIKPPTEQPLVIDNSNFLKLKEKIDGLIAIRPNWISKAGNLSSNGSKKVNVVNGYQRLPAFDGLIDMYIATKQISYLQLAVDMSIEYIDDGADMDGDGYLDWHSPYKASKLNHSHYEWRAAAGIGLTLSALVDNPQLTQFNSQKNKITQFLKREVWEKWTLSSSPATKFGNTNSNCTYFIGRLGFTAVGLHKSTGDSTYLNWINRRGLELVKNLTSHYNSSKDAYNMTGGTNGDDVAASPTPGTVDTSHGADAITFLIHAYQNKYTFSGELNSTFMDRLTNTVTNVMFTGEKFTANIDGSGGTGKAFSKSNGGWSKLSFFDEALLSKYTSYALNPTTFDSVVSYEARLHILAGLARATAAQTNK